MMAKGFFYRRNLYRNQEIMMAKPLLAPKHAETFLPDLYRNPGNMMQSVSLAPDPFYQNQEIMIAKGLFTAGTFIYRNREIMIAKVS